MLVEDGRRLLISNLDLGFLAKLSSDRLLLHSVALCRPVPRGRRPHRTQMLDLLPARDRVGQVVPRLVPRVHDQDRGADECDLSLHLSRGLPA